MEEIEEYLLKRVTFQDLMWACWILMGVGYFFYPDPRELILVSISAVTMVIATIVRNYQNRDKPVDKFTKD